MQKTDSLIAIALDLTAALTAQERYQRLLDTLRRVIPYDAAALFHVRQDALVITAASGLAPDAMGRPFRRQDHPAAPSVGGVSEQVS